ncbi:type II secretion system protein E [Oscillochloris trichoides DG-6]|uniref:Type II secretion system protein E n=1 Tax=Oscillochloris trichoides DG-6 TaxID=765420 RepID=E1IBI8_9CHLR|nr:ATPase, T2SS/T4P/T4SS family [Oscillochloris trichoides]EFO81407.1 type II secretion system protein E [Oscillochloris trichoides DG-6]
MQSQLPDELCQSGIDHTALVADLRMLVRSGRMRNYWHLPPAETFSLLGIGPDWSEQEWSRIDWYGPLEIWRDPEHGVSDIMFNGPAHDPFFIVQHGAMLNTGVHVHPLWIEWVRRQLLLRSGNLSRFYNAEPGRLLAQGVADRMRFAVTRPPITPYGISLSIRMLPERWPSIDDMVHSGTLSREAADLLLEALACGASVLVAGRTGSGKTTLTAALTQAVGRSKRLVLIEDGGELPRSMNSVHIDVVEEEHSFSQAVTFALRQKPHYIVVGEVRGGEAMAMLQAAATGHPGIGTIHAGSVQGALRNLERMAMLGLAAESGGAGQAAAQIVRSLISSDMVNLIVVHIGVAANGRRTILSIDEVLRQGSHGQSGEHFPTNPLFQHDPTRGALVRVGNVNADWGLGRL